ncbi:MAG: 4-hydroxy-3-methylbut-2-enyl diphosphate reductase [Desulfobacula sp.]|nr:4-hydroxy-3-methylbut-2-enyl diphosphate reductase [Desulfobacula sp.]
MKIVVAKTAGFCMGVRRAVDMVLDASNLSRKEPLYTYGPLIHNPQVLKMLEEKKIFRLDEIPKKGRGIVLIRAHGVPPEDEQALKDAGFTVINATCPRVIKVQVIINKYAQKGYSTIIIGDEKHPEVVGLLGYAENRGFTITSMEQFEELPKFKNAVIVAQTTQDTLFYDQIKNWCNINAPHYKIFDTICGSTERRQTEIRRLANENDAVIVVGGKQSGNTKRLAQIASGTGKPAVHIEDISQIDYKQLSSVSSIAITAGASTPNWIINETCAQVQCHLQKQDHLHSFFLKIRDFLLKTNIMAAAGAGSLTYVCSVLQGFDKDWLHACIAMLYVLSMQILNNLFMVKSDKYNNPQRALFYKNNKSLLWICAVLSGAAGLYLSFVAGVLSLLILLVMSLFGLSYNLKFIPLTARRGQLSRIKDLPGSKTILITIAWGTVTCLLPAVASQNNLLPVIVVFIFAAGLVFARTALFDILAIQGDRITGKETLPTLMGEKQSFNIIQYVLIFDICIILFAFFMDLLVDKAFILAFVPFIMLLLIRFFKNDADIPSAHREFIIESSFLGAGLVSAVI